MQNIRKVSQDLIWVGANDRRLALFESVYPIPRGVSYNSYVLLDEKTVLFDTVDKACAGQFFENLEAALEGRKLDYFIVSHMEPDHAAMIQDLVLRHPELTIVANAKAVKMLDQFFEFELDGHVQIVKEMDTLSTGSHTLAFVMAPMVHWPEVMVTFDTATGTLFSADAFGTFGALDGSLFADETRFDMDEARRYYTNIVGKYGTQVQSLLKKAEGLEIKTICPLHGPIWRKNIGLFVEKYVKWATYEPEENGVLIAYSSVYGDTENAANILAGDLCEAGVTNAVLYDVSVTHASYLVAEAFRYSHIVFATTTYNAGIFVNMENLINDIAAHGLRGRKIALVENGTWAATAAGKMKAILETLPGTEFIEAPVSIKSSVKKETREALRALAGAIAASMPQPEQVEHKAETKVEQNAMFSLSYGLFVLSAREGDKDNGCIVNTVMQVTDTPKRISVTVNKANYTCEMIQRTGMFNASILSTSAPMDIFRHYGFQSGRDTEKIAREGMPRTENGIAYLPAYANAVLSGKVIQEIDLGTHIQFIADVTEARVLSREPSVTYAYYFAHIKPAPQPSVQKKTGWVCKICGYVYEGEELPADFVCPLCKHGAEDFERVQ